MIKKLYFFIILSLKMATIDALIEATPIDVGCGI
jgi:hypothetical protein